MRTVGAVAETNRMYYAGWQMIAECNGAGTLQRKYVYGPGIDEPVRMTVAASPLPLTYYFHADGLGSVTEITGNTGQLVESYRYDVYGSPSIFDPQSSMLAASAIGNRLLFTGRDRDPETTWYNYRHRYYNPTLGRFVQPDPIGLEGGDVNFYRYVRNALLNYVDPYGLDDVNLIPRIEKGNVANADRAPMTEDFTVVGHLRTTRKMADSENKDISVEGVGDLITEKQRYRDNPDMAVRLNVCFAGKGGETGRSPFAQALANYLGRPVWGYTHTIGLGRDFFGRGRYKGDYGGEWILFQPANAPRERVVEERIVKK